MGVIHLQSSRNRHNSEKYWAMSFGFSFLLGTDSDLHSPLPPPQSFPLSSRALGRYPAPLRLCETPSTSFQSQLSKPQSILHCGKSRAAYTSNLRCTEPGIHVRLLMKKSCPPCKTHISAIISAIYCVQKVIEGEKGEKKLDILAS